MPNCYIFSVLCVHRIESGLNISSLLCLWSWVWTSVSILKKLKKWKSFRSSRTFWTEKKSLSSRRNPRRTANLYIRDPTWPDIGSNPVTSSHRPASKHFNHKTCPRPHMRGVSYVHSFLTSARDGRERSTSRPGRFIPGTQSLGWWVGTRGGQDVLEEQYISCHRRDSNPSSPNL